MVSNANVKLNKNGLFLYSPLMGSADFWMQMMEEDGSYYDIMYARAYSFLKKVELRVGSGNTAPTLDDYCLGNQINSLTKVNETVFPDLSNTGHKSYGYFTAVTSFAATYRNDTNSAITVNEIGVFYYNGSPVTSYGDNKWIMFARGVLDAPVEIAPGETYTFSITVD